MSWDLQLQKASFWNVPFEVQDLDDDVNRRITEYKYPWRDGADLDDLGRDARRTRITAVFYGPTYEADLSAFMQVVDMGKAGVFVHPVLGQWNARLTISSIRHSHDSRDMAIVQCEVIEDGTSTDLPDLFSISGLQDEVDLDAALVTEENTTDIEEVTDAVTAAQEFAEDVQTYADQVERRLNQVRKKIDSAITMARKLTDFENYGLIRSLKRLNYSCQRLGVRVQKTKPTIRQKSIYATVPLVLLAQQLYGDKSRADELQTVNAVKNPFVVPVGAEIKVYSE